MLTPHMIGNPSSSFSSSSACLFTDVDRSLFFVPPAAERTVCGTQRQKKARQMQTLAERIQQPPGPVEHKHALPPEGRESTRIHMRRHTQPRSKYFHSIFSAAAFLTSSRRLSVSSISSGPPPFPLSADVLEDDISASPAERHGGHQSPSFASLPGLPGDQLLSDFLAVVPPLNHSPGHAQVRKQEETYS